MKKLLVFGMDEFFGLVGEIMKGVNIELITTNVKDEMVDEEEITVDYIDLTIKKPLGQAIKTITDIVGYVDVKQDTEDEESIIVSIELTDLAKAIGDFTGETVIESYELFEANFKNDFEEQIAFHLA